MFRDVSVYIDSYKKFNIFRKEGAEIVEKAIILEKQALVNTISDSISTAKSTVVVEYRGVSVAKLEELRKELRKEGVAMKVYKNTLVTRASNKLGLDLDAELVGPNAFVFSYEDAVSAPRILAKFAKKERERHTKGKTGFINLVVVAGIVYAWDWSLKELDQLQALSHKNTGYIF